MKTTASAGVVTHPRELLLCVCLLAPAPVQALEITGSLEYGAYYTDNTALTEDDTVGEWVQEPGFNIGASHDTATLQLDAGYDYRRQIHQEDLFSDENVTTGRSSLLWSIVENRLDFVARNTRSQSTRRSQGTTNPDNLQVVSNTEIGPTLRLQPRQGDELQLEYRYLQDTRDATNDDSQRNNGTARYLLGLSENRRFVLQSTYSDIKYDNRPDADQINATIGYQQTGSDLDLDLNAGYSDFQRDGEDSVNGGIYSARLTWRNTGSSSISLSGNRSIQDQSNRYYDNDDFDDPIEEDSDTNAVYTLTDGEISWTQALGQRTSLTLAAYALDEDYDADDLDNTRYGGRASFSRDLTRTISLRARFDYSYRDYDFDDDTQKQYRAGLDVNHRLGRALTLSWGATYEDRDADTSQSYDETRFLINLSYQVLGARDR